MVSDAVLDDARRIDEPVMVDIRVFHPILHIDAEGNQIQVPGHVFVCVVGHDGLDFPDRPMIDSNEGPGSEIVQSRPQIPPVDLAEQTAVADRTVRYDRETGAEEQDEDQTVEHEAHGRFRRDGADEGPAAGQAFPYPFAGPGHVPDVLHQILPSGSQGPGAKPPDDQGDEGEGAYILQQQNGRRTRGAEVHGNRQAGGEEQGVDDDGHDDGHRDDHGDVDGRETRAELVHDDRDGSRVGRRARHEKDQRRSGTETLGDQRGGDRGACGCADVEGNADQDHDRVGQPAGVFVLHQIVRNHQIKQSPHGDPEEQREEDVVRDFDETVAKDVLNDFLEARQLRIPGRIDLRSVGRAIAGEQLLAIEVRLDPRSGPPPADIRNDDPEPATNRVLQL